MDLLGLVIREDRLVVYVTNMLILLESFAVIIQDLSLSNYLQEIYHLLSQRLRLLMSWDMRLGHM